MIDMEHSFSEDAVRRRSYLIWEREGRPCGKDHDHWRRALEELHAELHVGPPLRKPTAVVMPRLPISARPKKVVAARLTLKKAAVTANAATK